MARSPVFQAVGVHYGIDFASQQGVGQRLRAVQRQGLDGGMGGQQVAQVQDALEVADPPAPESVEPGARRRLSGAQVDEVVNGVEGLGEEKMCLPLLHGSGEIQPGEAAGLGLFDHRVPRSHLQTDMGSQLTVEQIEMIEGEAAKPAVGVFDDRGRPFLADAQHDLRVLGEPGPFGGRQQIGAGFGGGDPSGKRQPEAQQQQRAEIFRQFQAPLSGKPLQESPNSY